MFSFYSSEGWRSKEEEMREDAGDEQKEKKKEEKIGKNWALQDYVTAVESEDN